MKMIILSLLLVIALLIYVAPDVQEGRANVSRAADQYGRQLH
jgi:hypothetical protein